MSVNNGYLIPANPSPPDNRCVRVYVPNDPLYMAALLGTLTYLGQWTAWERDASRTGATAANRWKDANDLTLDGLSLPCGDNQITDDEMSEILDQLAQINSQLAELNDMNITVTQTAGGCGCGCPDGSTTTTTTTTSPPIISPDETGIVPIYDETAVVVVDSVKCRSANYLADRVSYMVRALGNLGAGGATIAGIITLLVTIVTWLTPIPGDEVLATSALIFYAMMIANTLRTADDFAFSIFGDLANEIDANMEAFVCALYGWNSASDLGNSLSSFINAKIDQIQPSAGMSTETATALKNVLNSLIGPALINWFVDHVASIVPADFSPMYDCTCGATGDNCPNTNLVIAGVGTIPDGDLTATIQGFASQFNSSTGYHEIVVELANNYCIVTDYGTYTPATEHETCIGGVMTASSGDCVRRFIARSLAPFAVSIDFEKISVDCNCLNIQTVCIDYGLLRDGYPTVVSGAAVSFLTDEYYHMKSSAIFAEPSGRFVNVASGDIFLTEIRLNIANSMPVTSDATVTLEIRDNTDTVTTIIIDPTLFSNVSPSWYSIPLNQYQIKRSTVSTLGEDIKVTANNNGTNPDWRLWAFGICIDYVA